MLAAVAAGRLRLGPDGSIRIVTVSIGGNHPVGDLGRLGSESGSRLGRKSSDRHGSATGSLSSIQVTTLNVVAAIDSGLVVAMDSDWNPMVNLDWVNVTSSHHAAMNNLTVVK